MSRKAIIQVEDLTARYDEDIILKTKKGQARIFKLDILKGIIWFFYEDEQGTTGPHPIKLNNVHRIIKMNQRKQFPEDLSKYILVIEPISKETDGIPYE